MHTGKFRFVGPAALVPMLLLLASAAHAGATFRLIADASASASDSRSAVDTPPTHDSGLVPIHLLPASDVIGNSSGASAQFCQGLSSSAAEFTLLAPGGFEGAMVRAVAGMSARTPGGSQSPQTASGAARALVLYDDVLTASGPPPGTPIVLRARLDLNGSVSRIGSPTATTCVAKLSFGDPGDTVTARSLVAPGTNGDFVGADSFVVQVQSGVPHPFELRLLVQAVGGASTPGDFVGGAVFNTASGEFRTNPHLGRLHIDVLTAGATYTLASGADLRSTAATLGVAAPAGAGALALAPPSPNPARGPVTLRFSVPAGGVRGDLTVFDLAGRAVWRASARTWDAGTHSLAWPQTDARGHAAAPGVYLARLVTDRGTVERRIVRL